MSLSTLRSSVPLESPSPLTLQHLLPIVTGLVKWETFGALLNVPTAVLRKLEEEHPRNVNRKVIEILQYWLDNDENPAYYNVIEALEKIPEERHLATKFRSQRIKNLRVANSPLKELTVKEREELAQSLDKIQIKFARLVTGVQKALESKARLNFDEVYRFVINYLGNAFTAAKHDPENITQLFVCLQTEPGYCFMDYHIIKVLVRTFVKEEMKEKLYQYKKALKKWSKSTTVQEFKAAVEGAANAASLSDSQSSDQCLVVLRLEGEWMKVMIKNLWRLLKYLFDEKSSILNKIKIIEGSVLVLIRVPKSELLPLLSICSQKYTQLLYLGVLSIQIGDLELRSPPVFPYLCFTFERGLCEAIHRKCDIALLQFLLDIGTRVNVNGLADLTPLMMAASFNNTDAISFLSKNNADLGMFSTNSPSSSAIHFAIVDDRVEAVKLLLKLGVSPNHHNCQTKITPLMAAALAGREEIVTLLLSQDKIEINFQDCNGYTALMNACAYGYTIIVKKLLDAGAKPNIKSSGDDQTTALHLACSQGHEEVVKQLLEYNYTDPNISLRDGSTPLMTAIYFKYYKIVKLLLQSGAYVDPQTDKSRGQATAILLASADNDTQTMSLLLNNMANVNVQDALGLTALQNVCLHGNEEMAQRLIGKGADPNLSTATGDSPLHAAIVGNNANIVSLLVNAGANPNATGYLKLTPLHLVCYSKNLAILEVLLNTDETNTNVLDLEGHTPLCLAASQGLSKIVEMFLMAGADTELEKDTNGWTPIFFAVQGGHCETLKLLLKHGAILKKDNQGQTPQTLAAEMGNSEAQKILSQSLAISTATTKTDVKDTKSKMSATSQLLDSISMYCKSLFSKMNELRPHFASSFKQIEHSV